MESVFLSPKTVSFVNYFCDFINRYDKDIKIRLTIDNTYSDAYLKFFGKNVEITIQKGNRFAKCRYDIDEIPSYLDDLDIVEGMAMNLIEKLKNHF